MGPSTIWETYWPKKISVFQINHAVPSHTENIPAKSRSNSASYPPECCHLVVSQCISPTWYIYFALPYLMSAKQIGFIMYGLHYTLFISYLRLWVNPCSKSILQYLPTLGVTLPIRWRIGVGMYEWPRWMYCFNQKGTSCRHRVVAWKVETWPIGLARIKTHPPMTFPLYYPPWYLINWGEYSAAVTSEQRELQHFPPYCSWFFFFCLKTLCF